MTIFIIFLFLVFKKECIKADARETGNVKTADNALFLFEDLCKKEKFLFGVHIVLAIISEICYTVN